MKNKKIIFCVLVAGTLTSVVRAAECPVPPTRVSPNISVKIDYDKKTKLYTYNYTVENGRSSAIPISGFMLKINEAPYSFLGPSSGWSSRFDEGEPETPSTFRWSTALSSIAPGTRKSGFILKSYRTPGPVRYFVRGLSETRIGTPTVDDDEPIPDCPGFYDDIPMLDGYVSGIVDGPAPENQVTVDLKLMDGKGERECGPISPYEDKGTLNVLLKASKGLKVSDIDLSSLRFGIGQAPLASSNRIGNSEEVILLKFDTQKVGIECERDRTIFLNGKTTDGRNLFGGATVKTKNCDKRPKRKKLIHRKNPLDARSNR
jgi:hypothetical protein